MAIDTGLFIRLVSGNVSEAEYLEAIENLRRSYGSAAADYIDDKMDSDDCGETYYLMLDPRDAAKKVEELAV